MSKRLLIRDQQGERERLLVGTMTVGRDTRCDISDADPLLSRRHAEFVCRPDSLIVRDLNSRNGITVNGVRVQEAVLKPGDVIKIARLVMTYLGDLGRAPADDRVRVSTPSTAKVPPPSQAPSGLAGLPPEDERTRVVARQGAQRAANPAQLAVARPTPSLPAQSQPPPFDAAASVSDDADRTRPIVRPEDVGTDTPVLPRSAGRAANPAPVVPVTATPPPPAAPPPGQVPLNDLSLEFRPLPLDAPQPPATPGPKTGGGRFLVATVGLAVLVFTLAAVPMIIWVTYRRDVPAVLWNFVVVLGPSLLCSLSAGFLLARWLRRTTTGG